MTTEEMKIVISARDSASGVLRGIQKSILSIGAAYLSWQAVKTAITAIVEATAEAETVTNNLRAAFARHGFEIESNLEKTDRFAISLMNLTAISDETSKKGIQQLIDSGVKLEESFRISRIAADMAAATGRDYGDIINGLGKAHLGYTRILMQYGIKIDENKNAAVAFEDALKKLEERFGGAAAAQLNTFTGQWNLLKVKFDELLESIGENGKPIIASFVALVAGAIDAIAAWFKSIPMFVLGAESVFTGFVDRFGDQIMDIIKIAEFATMAIDALSKGQFQSASMYYDLVKIQWNIMTQNVLKNNAAIDAGLNTLWNSITSGFKVFGETVSKTYDAIMTATEYKTIQVAKDISNYFDELREHAIRMNMLHMQLAQETGMTGRKAMEIYLKKDADSLDQLKRKYDNMYDGIVSSCNNAVSQLVGIWFGAQTSLGEIFRNMAQDFITMFLQEILRAAAKAVAKLVISLLFFDVPENDRAAMQSGRDYARHFLAGVNEGMGPGINNIRNISLAINPIQSIPSMAYAGGMTNNFIAVDWTEKKFKRDYIPMLEKAVTSGKSRVQSKWPSLTGKPHVIIN